MPVAAGVVDKAQVAAGVTGLAMAAQRSSAAIQHGAHHPGLRGGNGMRRQPVSSKGPEDLGERSGHKGNEGGSGL